MADPVERPSIKPLNKWGGLKDTLKDKLKDPKKTFGSDNWPLVTGSALLGLVVAAGAVIAAGPWDSGQRKAEQEWAAARDRTGGAHHGRTVPGGPAPAPSAPAVLSALGTTAGRAVPKAPKAPKDTAGLPDALGRLLDAPALGTRATAAVIDTATGEQLYGHGAATLMTPASTVKIATAAAALSALGPGHRITTTVRASPDLRTVTLVGGGDPTLDKAALRSLAAGTARALRAKGVTEADLRYDTSRYSGPALHPIGPNENIAPVSALMVDEGRLDRSDRGPAPRTEDPAGDAARAFAGYLGDNGVDTGSEPRAGRAPAASEPVATHRSAPLSGLVERALTNSDNDIAEALARQTALAAGEPADFKGSRRAVTAQLKKLKVPVTGARLADGSGLDRDDRVSAGTLAALLARAADPDHPELRPVLTGLPVAGFSGTLGNRYTGTSGGTGLIRAKTGTLTGVNALAGTVVDHRGRLLAFAFLASGTPSAAEAEPALDALATALTGNTR
ncbi:D-alanyl-D-alanine carboxypeptidase/D-alanyl-D-alanine-endopeptidase [Streptomyces sp. NBC_00654]|uniref:D-alanyl-D-alanine carboxypeptidase/D-alanyl-D-alanine endopeptidase n=1 Tax=Streptomyces sp. NBC_00654 TaxID=2975799 RepID=UPI0022560B3A|nr:D-alanyl-D-alanine carboxypeptidase/D-alanyl-D-alanine-endopeptidase [Streptomyces sp. NBC_00654]MCX4963887.1 D-alanyl-D-alanine carboxypeptidase/D-alanyl-D-alanine-endopeptidase [Streptomyces sp. NBC_00654]